MKVRRKGITTKNGDFAFQSAFMVGPHAHERFFFSKKHGPFPMKLLYTRDFFEIFKKLLKYTLSQQFV